MNIISRNLKNNSKLINHSSTIRDMALLKKESKKFLDKMEAGGEFDKKEEINKYFNTYFSGTTLEQYYSIFKSYLVDEVPSFEDTVGLDYGCWLGLSTIILNKFGNQKVYSCDFYKKELMDNIFDNIIPDGDIRYTNLEDNSLTIGESLDWIVLYDVICAYHYRIAKKDLILEFSKNIGHFYSLLREGSFLLISDDAHPALTGGVANVGLPLVLEILNQNNFKSAIVYCNEGRGRYVITAHK